MLVASYWWSEHPAACTAVVLSMCCAVLQLCWHVGVVWVTLYLALIVLSPVLTVLLGLRAVPGILQLLLAHYAPRNMCTTHILLEVRASW